MDKSFFDFLISILLLRPHIVDDTRRRILHTGIILGRDIEDAGHRLTDYCLDRYATLNRH